MTGRGPTDQELALRERTVRDFFGRSTFHRARFERAGLGRNDLRRIGDLRRLPVMRLDDVATPSDLLVETPAPGKRHRRQYWPLMWVQAGSTNVGYSAEDLQLLGALGRDILESAGVGGSDVLANVLPALASRDQLQFTLGAQTAGLSFAQFGTGALVTQIESISPTVIAGEMKELCRLHDAAVAAGSSLFDTCHTIFVVGAPSSARIAKKFTELFGDDPARIVRAWAPEGVFSLWSQCRGGEGFHTWSAIEVIEVVDPLTGLAVPDGEPGTLVWTGLEWYATAMLRLRTDATIETVTGTCPDCGRSTMRVMTSSKSDGFASVLDASPHVDDWFAELHRLHGADELTIYVALRSSGNSLALLSDLNERIGEAHVEVVDVREVERRRIDARGERFGDRRAARFAESATSFRVPGTPPSKNEKIAL